MSAALATVVSEVKQHLERHPSQAFRAVPLAKAIGEKDIRRVRQAISVLKDKGEVVTCTVYPGHGPADEEVRLSAAPIHTQALRVRAVADLPAFAEAARRAAAERPTVTQTPAATAQAVATKVDPAPSATPTVEQPRKRSEPGWVAPAAEKPAAPAESVGEPTPACIRKRRRIVPEGYMGPRQAMLKTIIEATGRALTAGELIAAIRTGGEVINDHVVWCALTEMRAAGHVVERGKIRPLAGDRLQMSYATPALAARLDAEKDTKGSDGETTPPESAVPGEAGQVPAAPQAIETARAKTVQAPAQARVEALRRDDVPTDEESPHWEALQRLAAHFAASVQQGDGAWHGFVWLVRVAGADVPTTLEILAAWQRAGRLAYSVADRAPIWRAVEGRW